MSDYFKCYFLNPIRDNISLKYAHLKRLVVSFMKWYVVFYLSKNIITMLSDELLGYVVATLALRR